MCAMELADRSLGFEKVPRQKYADVEAKEGKPKQGPNMNLEGGNEDTSTPKKYM